MYIIILSFVRYLYDPWTNIVIVVGIRKRYQYDYCFSYLMKLQTRKIRDVVAERIIDSGEHRFEPKVIARKRFYCYDVTLRLWSRKPFIYYACDLYIYIYTHNRSCSVWYIIYFQPNAQSFASLEPFYVYNILLYIVRAYRLYNIVRCYIMISVYWASEQWRSRGRKNITQTTEKIKRKERKR